MQTRLPHHQVVLLGLGHTNAHILRMWRMNPIPDAQLICISDFPYATYSGMLPGVLAGQYEPEQMQIDLVRACAASRARLILSPVERIDATNRRIVFRDRPEIPFDVLSIGIGSTPSFEGVEVDSDRVLPIKPMQTFLPRLDTAIDEEVASKSKSNSKAKSQPDDPLRVTIVGGGAGGVEITLCLLPHLRKKLGDYPVEITLIHGGSHLANNVMPKTERVIVETLEHRGTKILLDTIVKKVVGKTIQLADGQSLHSDITLWATGAVASEQLRQIELPHDDRGFLLVRNTLQSTASDHIFAVGDSGTMVDDPPPKAGVYAVRQGKILWSNIERIIKREPLVEYNAQKDFLKLLNLGDGKAVGQYMGRTFSGRFVFGLKDRIDRRFMEKHQNYEPAMMPAAPTDQQVEMRCQGCGGKVGGATLSNLFQRLDVKKNDAVIMGLDQPDDAALFRSNNGQPLAISTDYFSSPLDDPFIVGRVAALNATSDIYATGATPTVALTIASVPEGHPRDQEQLLYEVLAGSLKEFETMNVSLVGGHTIEAEKLTIGFTVVGEQNESGARKKSDLRVGDQLIMTQRLGVGILLAALMQAKCEHEWYEPLIRTVLKNNGLAMQLLESADANIEISSLTDITGFGLAGHLHEMLKASGLSARLELDKITLLPGVDELVAQGIQSTLAPDNRWISELISCSAELQMTPNYAALFDPQTNGGMLIAVQPSQVDSCLAVLHDNGFEDSICIGEIVPKNDAYEIQIVKQNEMVPA